MPRQSISVNAAWHGIVCWNAVAFVVSAACTLDASSWHCLCHRSVTEIHKLNMHLCVCSKCTRCFIEITKSYSITTSQFSHSCDLSQMHLPSISSSSLPTAPPFHSMHSPIPFALRRRRRRKQTNRHSAVSQRLTCATFYTYIIEDLFAYYVQYQHTRTHRMRILWIVMRYVLGLSSNK